MRQKKFILALIVVSFLFFLLTTRANAAPQDNPVFITLQRLRNYIEEAMIPLRRKLAVVEDRVEDLEVWTTNHDDMAHPQCATCTAEMRQSTVKVINEEGAINSLRSLFLAQDMYFKEDTDNNGQFDYAPAPDLLFKSGRLIDNVLGTGQKQGYDFILTIKPQNIGWEVIAKPSRINRTGDRSFYVDETGVIRASASAGVNSDSPPLEN